MTLELIALIALALLDGAFSGFRSSLGRNGLVDHTAEDRRGVRVGTALVVILLVPAFATAGTDLATGSDRRPYAAAGGAFLLVVGPYALLVLLALGIYGALGWRLRYLASALILGPLTLLRPYVVLAGALVAATRGSHPMVWVSGALACAAVLAVEPILDRRVGTKDHHRPGRAASTAAVP